MRNDKKLAVLWAKEHWQIAAFACVCLPVIGAVLVDLDVVSVRGAVAATVAAIAYVLMTTWNFTHDRGDSDKHGSG